MKDWFPYEENLSGYEYEGEVQGPRAVRCPTATTRPAGHCIQDLLAEEGYR